MAMRVLYLVRHGQYVVDDEHSCGGRLTALGKRQAARTGKRLREMGFDAIFHSDMPRAVETARIIAPYVGNPPMHAETSLRELVPPTHAKLGLPPRTSEEKQEVMVATPRLVSRFLTAPAGKLDRFELLVTHGNLIRFLVRLALEESPGGWCKYGTNNCGLTILRIREHSASNLMSSYNDVGHLPLAMQTMM